MPKRIINKIEKEYEKKGQTAKEAKKTAYKIVNAKGLSKDGKKRKAK